mgnify:CR=1 FL=1
MPVWQLNDQLFFPNPNFAEPDGLLAIGSDFSLERILLAYRSGIFPWFSYENEFYWFSPDPRCILMPSEIIVSKSMTQLFKKNLFSIKVNTNFKAVMQNCASIKRKAENETWIDRQFIDAYTELHHLGYAHSVEVYENDELVGGLYGLSMGACFFGESMFSKKSNASKYAFIYLAKKMQELNYHFIDCQVYNDHLASLGANNIPRKKYLNMLNIALQVQPDKPFGKV